MIERGTGRHGLGLAALYENTAVSTMDISIVCERDCCMCAETSWKAERTERNLDKVWYHVCALRASYILMSWPIECNCALPWLTKLYVLRFASRCWLLAYLRLFVVVYGGSVLVVSEAMQEAVVLGQSSPAVLQCCLTMSTGCGWHHVYRTCWNIETPSTAIQAWGVTEGFASWIKAVLYKWRCLTTMRRLTGWLLQGL